MLGPCACTARSRIISFAFVTTAHDINVFSTRLLLLLILSLCFHRVAVAVVCDVCICFLFLSVQCTLTCSQQ